MGVGGCGASAVVAIHRCFILFVTVIYRHNADAVRTTTFHVRTIVVCFHVTTMIAVAVADVSRIPCGIVMVMLVGIVALCCVIITTEWKVIVVAVVLVVCLMQ